MDKDYTPNIIDFIALRVTADFEPKIKDGLIAVEDIQDSVESVLIQVRLYRRSQGLHPLSPPARKAAQHAVHLSRL